MYKYTIAHDKSVFPYCELTYSKPDQVERRTILNAAKQGGRNNATKKQKQKASNAMFT